MTSGSQELRNFAEVLRGRRTINLFLQSDVPQQLILDAIEAATWAPNHHLTEPWHFYILGERAKEQCLDLCHDIVVAKKVTMPQNSSARAGLKNRVGWYLAVDVQKTKLRKTKTLQRAALRHKT